MHLTPYHLILAALLAANMASEFYLLFAIRQVTHFHRRLKNNLTAMRPPVSVLIPIRGLSPGLFENLNSFCAQDYPALQIVFGVQDEDDPAISTIRRVIAAWPGRDLTLVVGGPARDGNQKVSNLLNMFSAARHDLIVITDHDIRAGRHDLARLVSPFTDPRVGAVSGLYGGVPDGRVASVLGVLFINDWFFPSALVGVALMEPHFCFGALMAVRRPALEAIGGLAALAPYLADDYMLGHLVRQQGWQVRLAPCLVAHMTAEPGFAALLRHELRWSRTLRACAPAGHAFSFISNNALSLALLLACLPGAHLLGGLSFVFAATLRTLLHFRVRAVIDQPGLPSLLLLPVRDLLCLAVWAASFWGNGITWNGQKFRLQENGRLSFEGVQSS